MLLKWAAFHGTARGERRVQEHVGHATVAVVHQAHRAVQPVRVTERGLAVVVALGLDVQVDVDPALAASALMTWASWGISS